MTDQPFVTLRSLGVVRCNHPAWTTFPVKRAGVFATDCLIREERLCDFCGATDIGYGWRGGSIDASIQPLRLSQMVRFQTP